MYIVGTGFATEPGLPEGTTLELAIVPLIPTQHQLETEDPLMQIFIALYCKYCKYSLYANIHCADQQPQHL